MDKKCEDKKAAILSKIRAGLEELDHNLKILNQNLQVMGSIGNTQFTATSTLWSQFQNSVDVEDSTTFRGTTSLVPR